MYLLIKKLIIFKRKTLEIILPAIVVAAGAWVGTDANGHEGGLVAEQGFKVMVLSHTPLGQDVKEVMSTAPVASHSRYWLSLNWEFPNNFTRYELHQEVKKFAFYYLKHAKPVVVLHTLHSWLVIDSTSRTKIIDDNYWAKMKLKV